MKLNQEELSGVIVISGELDIDAAEPLRDALLEFLRAASDHAGAGPLLRPGLDLDLSRAESCDTAALQVLLAGCKQSARGGFRIVAASQAVTDTAAALGFRIPVEQGAS